MSARQVPTQPTIIPTGFREPIAYRGLDDLAMAVAGALGDRRLVLVRGMGSREGWDTFPMFSVHAENRAGLSAGPSTATYLCAVAVQDTPAEALYSAITACQARRIADRVGRAA